MRRDFVDLGGFGEVLGNNVSLIRKAILPTKQVLEAARDAKLLVMHTRVGHRPDLSDLAIAVGLMPLSNSCGSSSVLQDSTACRCFPMQHVLPKMLHLVFERANSFFVRLGEMMLGVSQRVGLGQGFLDGQTDIITPIFYILLHGLACTQHILGFDTSQDL